MFVCISFALVKGETDVNKTAVKTSEPIAFVIFIIHLSPLIVNLQNQMFEI
ncbi:hypothetical protein [Staphylococcus aureus subsp. aureus MW2]|nr:hypothetical protein [Staphylococcus aureus subsp. aureus MW2]